MPDNRYVYYEEVNAAILSLAGSPGKILDVGCGFGALGETLRNLGHEVVGIERNPEAAVVATNRLDRCIIADLTHPETLSLPPGIFDQIIFSDVLEHLPDPGSVLRAYKTFLKKSGRILVSVPNIACWNVRMALLFGRFNYTETGVLDRSHLRFFTFRSARLLLSGAGYRVEKVTLTPFLIRGFLPLIKAVLRRRNKAKPVDPRKIVQSAAYRFYRRWIYPTEWALARLWPGLLAFQIVMRASRTDMDSSREVPT